MTRLDLLIQLQPALLNNYKESCKHVPRNHAFKQLVQAIQQIAPMLGVDYAFQVLIENGELND